jgi:uncharacterized protein YndB with AHSA1/START domain
MVDILHRVGITASQDAVYEALTSPDRLAAWWTDDTRGDGAPGGVLEFRFEPGGFDMKVLEAQPAERVLWEVIGGPEEWIGTRISWDLHTEGRLHDRHVRPPRVAGAGGVHAPLQHQMGDLPDEPEGAPGDGHRRSGAVRREDQQLALTRVVRPGRL